MRSQAKHVANLFFTVLLAGGLTLTACSSNQQASAPEEPQETVSVEVIGPDANDKDADYVAKTDYALADVEHGPPGRCMRGASWAIWHALSELEALDRPWVVHAWGFASGLLYGGILNGWHVLGFVRPISWQTAFAAFAAGFPLDVVHGVATVVFLMAFWGPWRRSITRVVRKYDLGGGNSSLRALCAVLGRGAPAQRDTRSHQA